MWVSGITLRLPGLCIQHVFPQRHLAGLAWFSDTQAMLSALFLRYCSTPTVGLLESMAPCRLSVWTITRPSTLLVSGTFHHVHTSGVPEWVWLSFLRGSHSSPVTLPPNFKLGWRASKGILDPPKQKWGLPAAGSWPTNLLLHPFHRETICSQLRFRCQFGC